MSSFDYIEYIKDLQDRKIQVISILPQGRYLYVSTIDQSGKKDILYIKDFFPYFFIPVQELKYYKPFLPLHQVKQIFTEHPSDVKKQRESYQYTYEADILYDIRFSIDFNCLLTQNNKRAMSVPLHTWFMDIEVFREYKEGSPNPSNLNHFVNAIGIYDSIEKKYVLIIVVPEEQQSGIVNIDNETCLIKVRDERTLFQVFLQLLKKVRPVILSGWNIINFDLTYMIKRLQTFYPDLLDYFCIGPIGVKPVLRENENNLSNDIFIPGCSIVDLQLLYQKFVVERLESYRLDFVGRYEFGEGKVEIIDTTLDYLWKENIDKFIYYLKRDIELLHLIDNRRQFILFVNELKELSFLPIYYFNFDFTLKFHDAIIIQYLRLKYNPPHVIKSKHELQTEEKVKGAYVKVPEVGIHEWVIDLDASSMYPSGILSYNISPETFLGRVSYENIDLIRDYLFNRCSEEYLDDVQVMFRFPDGTVDNIKLSKLRNYILELTDEFTITYNGSIFDMKNKNALIPKIQFDLRTKRSYYKERMKLWKLIKAYVSQVS